MNRILFIFASVEFAEFCDSRTVTVKVEKLN